MHPLSHEMSRAQVADDEDYRAVVAERQQAAATVMAEVASYGPGVLLGDLRPEADASAVQIVAGSQLEVLIAERA